ncbi:MAG: 50S ribosomal protein L17 [Nitrospinae bacterium]|nr:50S ribosomal protein L17 [Nitrospinota bacterium]
MKHLKAGRKFGRKSAPRNALFKSLATALIKHGSIKTTLPKAKELRRYIEPLITSAKEETFLNYRKVTKLLKEKEAVKKLFKEIGPKYKTRPGGYTRIYKTGFRRGDNAPMSIISLVDNELKKEEKSKE